MLHEQFVFHGAFAEQQRVDQHVLGEHPPVPMQRLAQISQRAGLRLADLLQNLAAHRVMQLGAVPREPDRLIGDRLPVGVGCRGRRLAQPLFGLLQRGLHAIEDELQRCDLRQFDQRQRTLLFGAMDDRLDHLTVGGFELFHIGGFAALPAPQLIFQKAVDEPHGRICERRAQPHVHVHVVDAPRKFLEAEIDGRRRLERHGRAGRGNGPLEEHENSLEGCDQQSDHVERRAALTTPWR